LARGKLMLARANGKPSAPARVTLFGVLPVPIHTGNRLWAGRGAIAASCSAGRKRPLQLTRSAAFSFNNSSSFSANKFTSAT
jgi:hypothetical protein